MSGGFFRGTSADQDTRFSNKQAKLMKSQKFAPELEHLVDMTKVKMDVIKPWIAHRVTELLGFEDEVLINFISSLLDAKEVNGKEVQISLTGFMEKNTGKFMKELWTLLLSAQKNVSGVPQQLLDAKEEEARQKKVEADRIANEIQKKKDKENREIEQEKLKKMDGVVETKSSNAAWVPTSKPRASGDHSEDEKEADKRNGERGRTRVSRSPHSAERSPSSPRGSPSRSISKSFSNSRSYSNDRHKSRSPEARGRSISSERAYRSSRRRSITPRRRHSPLDSLSPPRRRSFYSRRRSRSPSVVRHRMRSPFRRRSPSPVRRRRSPSPVRRRRSPSPLRRRGSPSPIRRRGSPLPIQRRRSPSPIRRRRSPSPVRRRRSPSPVQRKTPFVRRRSPSPIRRRSPPPVRRRSPSPSRHGSPSPIRRRYRRSPSPRRSSLSPVRRRSPIPGRRRSPTPSRRRASSPNESSSPSPIQHTSSSPVRRKSPKLHRSPLQSPKERIRMREKLSPVAQQPSSSLRSQRDPRDRNDTHHKVPASLSSPEKSRTSSESPPRARNRGSSEERRSFSPYQSPVRQTLRMTHDGSVSPQRPREHRPRYDSRETSEEEEEPNNAREDVDHKSNSLQKRSLHSAAVKKQKDSPMKVHHKEGYSPERLADRRATESRAHPDNLELRKKEEEMKSEKSSGRGVPPEFPGQQKSPPFYKDSLLGDRQQPSYLGEGKISDEKNRSRSNNVESNQRRLETVPGSVGKVDNNNGRNAPYDSGSEESDKHRTEEKERRKHKRSQRKELASDDEDSYESELEGRKEAKRRRKEDKKLRKEEKRRRREERREERRRRREERRAEKLKVKSQDNAYTSDGEHTARGESHPSDDEDARAEQKKLEIELRKKALESLKAKKGINH